MLSSSARASAGSSTGVCPDVTTCRGPRTDAAGLTDTTWPVTSQSNRWRIAASRCLTLGAASSRVPASIQVATCTGWTAAIDRHAGNRAPGQEFIGGAGIGPARVQVADIGGEEFEEAHRRALAGDDDERGHLALPCGQRHQARIHAESSGREMRNKGARRSPLRVGSSSSISPTFCRPQCRRTFCEAALPGSV